ncbi:hypothetical protein [Thiocystis violascens]|uniref:hypothetical protein n=1 Tax=Thiocystis violascens TaxID=73141 RepID=UPI0012F63D12|nr:hypothetical protein [Thiocystis violascens]
MITQWTNIATVTEEVIAPILTAYVAWILQHARRHQIERLYFVSRDGQILQLIASVLRRDGDPECRYLYGSRQAWFLPSVRNLDEESLKWAWMKGLSRSGRDILRRLEIDEEPVLSILAHEGFDEASLARQLDENELERIKALIRKEPIASLLLRKAETRRMLLLEYLRQEDCLDGANWALVDIGWKLNCQHSLSRVMKYTEAIPDVTGYYFGVSSDHAPLEQAGAVYPFISHSRSRLRSTLKADWIFKRSTVAVIENFFVISDYASVCGYRRISSRVEPIFKDAVEKREGGSLARIVHATVLAYVNELASTRSVDPESEDFQRRSIMMMKRFCLYPKPIDVMGIALLPINDDQTHGEEHWNQLAVRIDMRLFLRVVGDYLTGRSEDSDQLRFSWVGGSAAISSWPVRIVIISGSALSRTFDSLRIWLDRSLKWTRTK